MLKPNVLHRTVSNLMTARHWRPLTASILGCFCSLMTLIPGYEARAQSSTIEDPFPEFPDMGTNQSPSATVLEELTVGTAPPTPTPSPIPSELRSMQDLQLELFETAYKLDPSETTRSELLRQLERHAIPTCAPQWTKTLTHTQPVDSEPCRSLLSRTVQLDPGNAVVRCLLFGMTDTRCTSTFKSQVVTSYDPDLAPAGSRSGELAGELSTKLSLSRNQELISSLRRELETFARNVRRQKTAVDLLGFEKSAAALLRATCVGDRLRSLPAQVPSPNRAAGNPTPTIVAPLFGGRLSADEGSDSLPVQPSPRTAHTLETLAEIGSRISEVPSARTREITAPCLSSVGVILQTQPEHAGAICARDGYFTPSCFRALRIARARKNTQGSGRGTSSRSDGLSEF